MQACVENSICCNEIRQTADKIEELGMDVEDGGQCLSKHSWFEACCLHPATLQIAYLQYRAQCGQHAVEGTIDQ